MESEQPEQSEPSPQDSRQSSISSAKFDAKSAEATELRIRRIGNAIDPVELKKGEAPVRLDVEKLMKLYNVPGLSLAVIEDYKIAWVKSYGVTEPGGSVPVTPEQQLMIDVSGKQFPA